MTHGERKERRKLIAKAVRSGKTVREVAKEFGVGRHTVTEACRENGVAAVTEKFDSFGAYKVIAALFRGESYNDIAGRAGVTPQRVGEIYRKCVAEGIPLPPRSQGRPKKGAVSA